MQSLALAPSIPQSVAADLRRTAIDSLEIFTVRVNRRGNWLLVRIRTNNGLTGIGDASHGGSDAAKRELIPQFFDLIKGRSPSDVEWLRTKAEPVILKRGSPAAVAMSSLEQCMWDLQGKICSCPAYAYWEESCGIPCAITQTSTARPKFARRKGLRRWQRKPWLRVSMP